MPLVLTSEQELLRKVVREFAEKELAPEATSIDRESRFPRRHYAKFAQLGLLGMFVPAEAGGSGTDTLSYVVATEEVARSSGTDAGLLILQNAIVAPLLHALAMPEQGGAHLPATVAGQRIGGIAFTEESGGSSLADILTTANPGANGYLVRGSKAFVSLAREADFYLLLAQVPQRGPSLFLLPRDAPGIHFAESESKLGLRGLPLAEMYLNRVTLPSSALLGTPGAALDALREPMLLARLGVASALVGLTQAALEMSIEFARNRVQFSKPIIQFGAIRDYLADVQADLEAARATLYDAAQLRDRGEAYAEEVFEARLLAHRTSVTGTRVAHKIHGGAGFMRDLPLERVSRDARTIMHMWDGHDITRSKLAGILLD